MSNFLSNFTSDNYQKKPHKNQKKSSDLVESQAIGEQKETEALHKKQGDENTCEAKQVSPNDQTVANPATKEMAKTASDDLLVKDTAFAKKKLLKRLCFGAVTLLILGCICGFYYNQTHIKLPDFTGKPVSRAQTWADKYKINLDVKRVYNFDKKVNTIIKEPDKHKVITKKKVVDLTVSLGANPKTKIKLPDFSKLSLAQARKFVKKEKLDNTTIQLDYSETIAKDSYIKQEFTNQSLTSENFKREDNLTLFYSKGKELVVKNIDVPDFSSQTKEQIDKWSKDKGVKIDFQTEGSNTVEVDKVITQSVAKGEKVSKADTIIVKRSLGKPLIVPDFSEFSFEEASAAGKELPVAVKQVYSDSVAYGGFITQSISAGTQYSAKDNIPNISVFFSIGQVYIKDLTGQTQGDLQATFYNEYTAKGAPITYQVQYVDSSETKGVVVGQSSLNEVVPLNSHVIVMVSNGKDK